MSSGEDTGDEFLEGIYQPDIKPSLTDRVLRTDFKPWHKPRKHYIRIYQWCAALRSLINQIGYGEGDVVRYLGFPGEDFLDVRCLQGVCSRAKVKVKYLGFDSTAAFTGGELNFHLSRHEVFELGFIDQNSSVLKARIEQVADENTLAFRRVSEFRDFDIINIDLCGSIATTSQSVQQQYFEAVKKLCDIQISGRTRPWLLLLATRAIRDQLDFETKWKLFKCIENNINQCSGFEALLRELIRVDGRGVINELSGKQLLTHQQLVNAFCLSIGKWLLGIAMAASPKLKVKLLKSYSYRVEIDQPDMLSLAFMFEPIAIPGADRSGLTASRSVAIHDLDECSLAADLLAQVSEIVDIDQHLFENSNILVSMINKCAVLLESARYDKESYKDWATRESWRPEA